MAKKETKKKTDKHHGAAGDGHPLVPIKKDGTPAAYDKYGNKVTEGTGKGKGVVLKNYRQVANKSISAPSPEEITQAIARPFWSINSMPIDYIYNNIIEYFNSLIEPVYERVAVLDDEGNPVLDFNGKEILRTTLVSYVYKNVPSRYGLAQALGIELSTLDNYLRIDTSHDDSSIDTSGDNSADKGYRVSHQTTYVNRDNHLLDLNNNNIINILYNIYGEAIYYDNGLREELRRKTEKDIKIFLLKRARVEIMKYHEQRLGLNENVTGSLFALLNSKDGWTNDHTVKIEFPDLLGKTKSIEELDAMTEIEGAVVYEEKDGVFVPAKDLKLDD